MAVINIFLSLKNSFWGIKERHQLLMRFLFFVYTTSEFICNYNLIQCCSHSCRIIFRATTRNVIEGKKHCQIKLFFLYYYFITSGHSVLCLSVRQDIQTAISFNLFYSLLSRKQASCVQQITAHFIFNSAADCCVLNMDQEWINQIN